jgi:hypothetical protein
MAIDRTGDVCNKGCGVDLGIRQHLLGTTKEWMILKCYTCSKCKTGKRCAVEGCDKFPQTGCNGHCLGHATQEQKDAISNGRKKTGKRCAVEVRQTSTDRLQWTLLGPCDTRAEGCNKRWKKEKSKK